MDDVRASAEALRGLLAHLEEAHRIPAERLFIMGFSQGCLMTLELGLTHHRRFAGLIGISGWVFDHFGVSGQGSWLAVLALSLLLLQARSRPPAMAHPAKD